MLVLRPTPRGLTWRGPAGSVQRGCRAPRAPVCPDALARAAAPPPVLCWPSGRSTGPGEWERPICSRAREVVMPAWIPRDFRARNIVRPRAPVGVLRNERGRAHGHLILVLVSVFSFNAGLTVLKPATDRVPDGSHTGRGPRGGLAPALRPPRAQLGRGAGVSPSGLGG